MNLIAVLSVCGVAVSSVSLQHHFASSKTEYCDIAASFSCDIVNRSAYSTLFGIPVALIGVLGYASLAALATLYRARPQTPRLLLAGAAAGLAFASYLTYIEGQVLGVWCILCLTSFSLIALITILATVAWTKRGGG